MIFILSLFTSSLLAQNFDFKLINGKEAALTDFPSSIYMSTNGSRCSSTLIGEQVLLTAAHCVSDGGKATFRKDEILYSGKCTHHKDYQGNDTADWALCLLDKKVPKTVFENVLVKSDVIKVGTTILLSGYGCTYAGGWGGNDGKLRIGTAKVIKTPSGKNYDVVTNQGSAICYGDSGGSAFLVETGTGKRWVIAVNSRGDIATTSYLSSVYNSNALTFFKDWSKNNAADICGLSQSAKSCRDQTDPTPSPSASPSPDITPIPEVSPSPDISPNPSVSPIPTQFPSPIPSVSPNPLNPTPAECKTAHYTVFSCFNAGIYEFNHCMHNVKILEACVLKKYDRN